MKIKTRLVVGFGIILVLIVLLNGLSIANLRSVSNLSQKLYDGPHMGSLATTALLSEANTMDALLKGDVWNKTFDAKALEEITARIGADIVQINSTVQLDTDLVAAFDALQAAASQVGGLIGAGEHEQAAALLNTTFRGQLEEVKKQVGAAALEASNQAQAFNEKAQATANRTIILQDILFVVIVLASLITALKMSVDIARPIRRLTAEVSQVAAGHFDVELDTTAKDEVSDLSRQLRGMVGHIQEYVQEIGYVLGEISRGNINLQVDREYIGDFAAIKGSLNQIIGSLNATMHEIYLASNEVRGSAYNVAQGAQSLSRGAAEQADAIAGLSRTAERVAAKAAQDASNAQETDRISMLTMQAARESDNEMKKMIVAMQEINKTSEEIAKVVKVIDEIANQTNILALNAAVEAARAGAAGKGFAVVADEVRSLASKSAQEVKNTTGLIESSIQAVKEGVKIATETAGSLEGVVGNVSTVAAFIQRISTSSAQQVEDIAQVTQGMEQISQVVQQNSTTAGQSAAASDALSAQAGALERLVGGFQLKNEEAKRPETAMAPDGAC